MLSDYRFVVCVCVCVCVLSLCAVCLVCVCVLCDGGCVGMRCISIHVINTAISTYMRLFIHLLSLICLSIFIYTIYIHIRIYI